jgi:hypothetical protein
MFFWRLLPLPPPPLLLGLQPPFHRCKGVERLGRRAARGAARGLECL